MIWYIIGAAIGAPIGGLLGWYIGSLHEKILERDLKIMELEHQIVCWRAHDRLSDPNTKALFKSRFIEEP